MLVVDIDQLIDFVDILPSIRNIDNYNQDGDTAGHCNLVGMLIWSQHMRRESNQRDSYTSHQDFVFEVCSATSGLINTQLKVILIQIVLFATVVVLFSVKPGIIYGRP